VANNAHPLVSRLSQLRAIGLDSAWKLDKELFGWRSFSNRRQLGASLGLTPTPYDSGNSQVEQGNSKAGNKRLRSLLVELAWSWLRYQPDSALSQWYGRRFAAAGKRMRRVGIVASPGDWPSPCGDTCSTARSRQGNSSSRPRPEPMRDRIEARPAAQRMIMIKGRRARNVRGSPCRDRQLRWGASVIGVCPSASRACCMWCRMNTSGTDRSSVERRLERSSHPSLGSARVDDVRPPVARETTRPCRLEA
jgi:hypothetical protein